MHTEREMVQKELGAKATLVDTHELLEGGRERMTVVLEAAQIEARTELLQVVHTRTEIHMYMSAHGTVKAEKSRFHIISIEVLVLRPLSVANH